MVGPFLAPLPLGGLLHCFPPDAVLRVSFHSLHLPIVSGDSRRLPRHTALTLWGARVARRRTCGSQQGAAARQCARISRASAQGEGALGGSRGQWLCR
eukprot:2517748-Prymnesium_polylepis.1